MTPTQAQEIFDRVATHLLTQNARSSIGQMCLYRGPEGRKCAIGALISDEHYTSALESKAARRSEVCSAVEKSLGFAPDPAFLSPLQCIHDIREPDVWKDELRYFAERNDLSPAVLEEVQP